jgi:hypothetical protein
MRGILLAATAMALAPITAHADELSDLQAQLQAAMKSIQSLQERVHTLEAEKNSKAEAEKSSVANGFGVVGSSFDFNYR